MAQTLAAGLLMYRSINQEKQYFLVHPGGPFYVKKDNGVWTIPKGLPEHGEDLLTTAQREFFEETGIKPTPPFSELGTIRQKGGKVVHAWAFAGDWDPSAGIKCNLFSLEWPPRSGTKVEFPEVDRAEWFSLKEAKMKIRPEQILFLERLNDLLALGNERANQRDRIA